MQSEKEYKEYKENTEYKEYKQHSKHKKHRKHKHTCKYYDKEKKYTFEKIDLNDLVKFKILKDDSNELYDKDLMKFDIYYGKVVDVSKEGVLGILIDENDERYYFPKGIPVFIDRRSVLQTYPFKIAKYLSPRLALKQIWKSLIFREIKTAFTDEIDFCEYRYISETGFEQIEKYQNMEEAFNSVPLEYRKNIVPFYKNFYGFTSDKILRNNDHLYDKEIFFSKKCYVEIDWSDNPTADFSLEKEEHSVVPFVDSLICGIPENGQKGPFFRKWFLASKEFFTLWTMVCEPKDSSLYENNNIVDKDAVKLLGDWADRKTTKTIKSFEKLLKELDTSCYSIDMKSDIEERKQKYNIYNLEKAALFYTNRYKQAAEAIFSKGLLEDKNSSSYSFSYSNIEDLDSSNFYSKFQKKLIKNIMWPKKVK